MEAVRVRNLSDKDFHGKYNSKPFVVPAKGDAMMEKEAAIIWFGNWETRNIDDSHQDRRNEYNRIRGIYGGHITVPPGDQHYPNGISADELWEQNRPHVEVYDPVNASSPVVLVIDDPDGSELPIQGAPEQDKERMLMYLKDQIDVLTKALEDSKTEHIPIQAPVDSPPRRRQAVDE